MPRKLDGQKLLQVWQWGQPAQAETTLAEAIDLCRRFGYTGISVKALDGDAWMGDLPVQAHAPEALRSLDDIRRQADECHAAGLYYAVWTNPLGLSADEPRMTGEIAALPELDALFLDVEPYDRFWGVWRPSGLAQGWMEQVRALAPSAIIALQPDPRPNRLAEIRPEEWLPYCDAFAGQHYFSTFGADPTEEMDRAYDLAVRLIAEYPHVTTLITLPSGSTDPDQLDIAVRRLEHHGFPALVHWRMGDANARQLTVVGSFLPSVVAPPADPHDPGPVPPAGEGLALSYAELVELRRELRELRGAIERVEIIIAE